MNLQSLVNKVPAKAKAVVKVVAKAPKAVKVAKVRVKLEPFTVFYKESRKKFMAVNGKGQTEAARPTVESALAFLKNKYDVVGKVL